MEPGAARVPGAVGVFGARDAVRAVLGVPSQDASGEVMGCIQATNKLGDRDIFTKEEENLLMAM